MENKTCVGVFIASPSDAYEERICAMETITSWNQMNWNNTSIHFTPLMWETGSVSDLEHETQDAINRQLLTKADCLIGIFRSRLGTETEDYPSGTAEEIAKRPEVSAVYHMENPHQSDGDFDQWIEEIKRLRNYLGNLKGYKRSYKNVDDLGRQLSRQLTNWAERTIPPPPPLYLTKEPVNYEEWYHEYKPKDETCEILLYNIELITFRHHMAFERAWSWLDNHEDIDKIIMLLPDHKIRRLEYYLDKDSSNFIEDRRLRKFELCSLVPIASSSPRRLSTGIAFSLLRKNGSNSNKSSVKAARVFPLTEPFAAPERGKTGDPDVSWNYTYSIGFSTQREITDGLIQIWEDQVDANSHRPVVSLIKDSNDVTAPIDGHKVESMIDFTESPTEKVELIRTLRGRLFDPNVPSYCLDNNYFLLDWNPAFELIFPTQEFYRGEHVMEFVKCLQNIKEAMDKGVTFEQGIAPQVDLERLDYQSPKYGLMRFTKIASLVEDPVTRKCIGWVIALNLNQVDDLGLYEQDLKEINYKNALVTMYAGPYEKIISDFPEYLKLVQMHADAMGDAKRILDLGSGPGVLALELLRRRKQVTAVDQCDAMLDALRRRCEEFPAQLGTLKANLETVHPPNMKYSARKIGMFWSYNGAVMLNVLYTLQNPSGVLDTLSRLLKPGAPLSISIPLPNSSVEPILSAIQEYRDNLANNGKQSWTPEEYEAFSGVNLEMENRGELSRYSLGDVQMLLEEAKFTVERIDENIYVGQGAFILARRK